MKDTSVSDANSSTVVQETESQEQEKKDQVSYESHQRLLKQLKRAQEEKKELESRVTNFDEERKSLELQKKQAEEKKLQEKGEFKKLLELRENELKEMRVKFESVSTEKERSDKAIQDTIKLHAVYDKLPGKIKNRDYLSFIELENIAINPDSGEIDESSVDAVVNKFMDQHGSLVDTSHMGKLPAGHALGSKNIDYETWKKQSSKDMKKSLQEAINKRMAKYY